MKPFFLTYTDNDRLHTKAYLSQEELEKDCTKLANIHRETKAIRIISFSGDMRNSIKILMAISEAEDEI